MNKNVFKEVSLENHQKSFEILPSNRVKVVVNLNNLRDNFKMIKALNPNKKIISIIKSNAYGHGIVEVAKTLEKSDYFGTTDLKEAYCLRQNKIKTPIVVMSGIWNEYDFFVSIEQNIHLVVYEESQLEKISMLAKKTKKNIQMWVKIDSGMNRLGIMSHRAEIVLRQLTENPFVKSIVVMTHFANADNTNKGEMDKQRKSWAKIIKKINDIAKITCLTTANSSTVLNYNEDTGDIIRPGLILYGIVPKIKGGPKQIINLKQVMTLKSSVISIKKVSKGEAVGYGSRWKAKRDSMIAIGAIGYGDGYDRHMSDGTPVLVNGQKAMLAGRVSMNMISIDVTDCKNINIGDEVIVFGEELPLNELEKINDFSAYDVIISAGSKAPIEYKA